MRISGWSADVGSSDLGNDSQALRAGGSSRSSGSARQWIRQAKDRPTPIMSNSRTREEGRHIVSNLSPGDEFAQIMIQRIIASGDCESTPCRPYRMLAKGERKSTRLNSSH